VDPATATGAIMLAPCWLTDQRFAPGNSLIADATKAALAALRQ
jgi:hypothetical protein